MIVRHLSKHWLGLLVILLLAPSYVLCERTENYSNIFDECVRVFEEDTDDTPRVETCLLEAMSQTKQVSDGSYLSHREPRRIVELCNLLQAKGAKDRLQCRRYFAKKLRNSEICKTEPYVDNQCVREVRSLIWETPLEVVFFLLIGAFSASPLLIAYLFRHKIIPLGRFHKISRLVIATAFFVFFVCSAILFEMEGAGVLVITYPPLAGILVIYSAWLLICLIQAQDKNKYIKKTLIVLAFAIPLFAPFYFQSLFDKSGAFLKKVGSFLVSAVLGAIVLLAQGYFLHSVGHLGNGWAFLLFILWLPIICLILALLGVATKTLTIKLDNPMEAKHHAKRS